MSNPHSPWPRPAPTAQPLLAEALRLARSILTQANPERLHEQQQRLIQLHSQLQALAHPLNHVIESVAAIPIPVRLAFAQACGLLSYYPHLGAAAWYGPLTPHTLERFTPDPLPPALQTRHCPETLSSLWTAFELPQESLSEFQVQLSHLEAALAQQQQVIQQIRQAIEQESVLRVFQALLGPLPIPEACLTWGSTDWQLYFCLSYEQGCLCTYNAQGQPDYQAWNQLDPEARSEIQRLIEKLHQFQYDKFDRFPIFGAFDPEQLDWAWVQTIAKQSNTPACDVVRILRRSISILPTAIAESFLIHDIWGHHWQLWLTSFLNDYEFLSDCDRPLWPGETAYTIHGPLACRDLFQVEPDQNISLDQERAILFFHGEVQQRLGFLFTHLLGEMLADVAEFKFACHFPAEVDCLQSSSLFPHSPTKLDLSLFDLDFLFLRVLKPLLDIDLSVFQPTPLETSLLSEWAHDTLSPKAYINEFQLKAVIAQLYALFFREFQAYAPQFETSTGFFAALVLNLLHLQNAINQLYHHPITESPLPIRDLLLVFIGCYCSQDCYQEFWTIDDVLAEYFLPCCGILQAWLETEQSQSPAPVESLDFLIAPEPLAPLDSLDNLDPL